MKKILSILFVALIGAAVVSCVKDEPFPVPPLITDVVMAPLAPEAGQEIVISATVRDIGTVTSVKLLHRTGSGDFVAANMTKVGASNVYTGTIPAQPALTVVQYYIEAENDNNKKAVFPATAPATPAAFTVGGAVIFHYWHFNALPARVEAPATVPSDFTFPGTGAASILYLGAFLDPIDPGTAIRAQMGAPAGTGLRVRSVYGDLVITAPSTGFRDLEMSFALSRSGTGANIAQVQYSTDGGATWITIQTFSGFPGEPVWTGYDIDLRSITGVNNNANLRFKIIPSGSTTGNLRIDNISISGKRV